MPLSQEKQLYLSAMGIVSWHLRDTDNKHLLRELSLGSVFMIKNQFANINSIIVADANIDLEKHDQEKNLLISISKAIGFENPTPEIQTIEKATSIIHPFFKNSHSDCNKKLFIFLGAQITESSQSFLPISKPHSELCGHLLQSELNYCLIHLSLAQLLNQPQLKARLWHDLQPILQLIKS